MRSRVVSSLFVAILVFICNDASAKNLTGTNDNLPTNLDDTKQNVIGTDISTEETKSGDDGFTGSSKKNETHKLSAEKTKIDTILKDGETRISQIESEPDQQNDNVKISSKESGTNSGIETKTQDDYLEKNPSSSEESLSSSTSTESENNVKEKGVGSSAEKHEDHQNQTEDETGQQEIRDNTNRTIESDSETTENKSYGKKENNNRIDDEDEDDSVPTDRMVVNYADKNLGALVLEKSPASFSGTSNLLTSDRDKYAIVPCNEDKKHVVIGLSEDILVKQIVISNFERYSSHVQNFQVMGSQTLGGKWTDFGTFKASVGSGAGTQAFELKEPSWARYLKFKFLSHYGGEHYCTVSQIKVHGSTMLQGFHEQWNQKEVETKQIIGDDEKSNGQQKSDEKVAEPIIESTNITSGENVINESTSNGEESPNMLQGDDSFTEKNVPNDNVLPQVQGNSSSLHHENNKNASESSSLNVPKDELALEFETSNETIAVNLTEIEMENSGDSNGQKLMNESIASKQLDMEEFDSNSVPDLINDTSSSIGNEQEASNFSNVEENTRQEKTEAYYGKISDAVKKIKNGTITVSDAVKKITEGSSVSYEVIKDLTNVILSKIPGQQNKPGAKEKSEGDNRTINELASSKSDEEVKNIENASMTIDETKVDDMEQTRADDAEKDGVTISHNQLKEKPKNNAPDPPIIRDEKEVVEKTSDDRIKKERNEDEEPKDHDALPQSLQDGCASVPMNGQIGNPGHLVSSKDESDVDAAKALPSNVLSVSCIEKIGTFNNYKAKITKQTSSGSSSNNSGGNAGNGAVSKMEPIFKTLTDEIKLLQLHQTIYDQYMKNLVECYEQALLDISTEITKAKYDQQQRIAILESMVSKLLNTKQENNQEFNMLRSLLKEIVALALRYIFLLVQVTHEYCLLAVESIALKLKLKDWIMESMPIFFVTLEFGVLSSFEVVVPRWLQQIESVHVCNILLWALASFILYLFSRWRGKANKMVCITNEVSKTMKGKRVQ